MSQLFVLTGANGAGKSTLSQSLLPNELIDLSVFYGDKLFVQRLSEIFPAINKSPKYARKMAFDDTVNAFESLVEQSLTQQQSFAYEGHFSSESPWQTLVRFKKHNYRIIMVFLMVEDLSISFQRVIERVKTGGHYVTPQEIEKNYFGNLTQLNNHLDLLDELILIDNSKAIQPALIAHIADKNCIYQATNLPKWFTQYLPKLNNLLNPSQK